ncbi:MAG: hypothetical protein J6112_07570 [Clostridia bacterium]|nr:hypothetical protein [Clostridia bacterium]
MSNTSSSKTSSGRGPSQQQISRQTSKALQEENTMRDLTKETTISANTETNKATVNILPALTKVDPQLAVDAKAQLEADKERLAQISRKNGALGGRPRVERTSLAKQCVDAIFTKHGQFLTRYYRRGWYLYTDGCFSPLDEENIEMKVSGWLIRSGAADVSATLTKDILKNLKSDQLCGLTEDNYKMPCFISTRKPAVGYFSMKNGVIQIDEIVNALKNGLPLPPIHEHTPDLFTTVRLPYEFDPTATCPKFEAYLEGVQPKAENREMLQMLAGLILTPDMSYNVAFFLYGVSGTGKSVFLNTLVALVGVENTCCVPLSEFADKHSTWPLTEKLLNAIGDMPKMKESEKCENIEGVLKEVTCGGLIKTEPKFVNVSMARATARCVFATNHLPYFADRSGAIHDRLRIIPFNQVFRYTERQNSHLEEELLEELPGILNWALQGLVKLRMLKVFPHCEEGRLALEKHMGECDHEGTFLQETTEANPDRFLWSRDLHKKYCEWAAVKKYKPLGESKFNDAIRRIYPNAEFPRKNDGAGHKYTCVQGVYWLP